MEVYLPLPSFLSRTEFNALKWIHLSDNWARRFRPASARYSAKKKQQWQSTYVCNSSCIYVHCRILFFLFCYPEAKSTLWHGWKNGRRAEINSTCVLYLSYSNSWDAFGAAVAIISSVMHDIFYTLHFYRAYYPLLQSKVYVWET